MSAFKIKFILTFPDVYILENLFHVKKFELSLDTHKDFQPEIETCCAPLFLVEKIPEKTRILNVPINLSMILFAFFKLLIYKKIQIVLNSLNVCSKF